MLCQSMSVYLLDIDGNCVRHSPSTPVVLRGAIYLLPAQHYVSAGHGNLTNRKGSLPSEICSVRLGPPRLQQRRNERQREGRDEVSGHEDSLETVVWVARELGRVAAELVEGVGREHLGRGISILE